MAQDYEYNQQIYDLLQEQLDQYPEMKEELMRMSEEEKRLLITQYGNKREELGFKTGESIYDFMSQYRGAQGKGGFAGSGALERGRERGMGLIQKGHEFGSQTLSDQFGEGKLALQKDYWNQANALDKWRSDLKIQQTGLDTDAPTFWDRMFTAIKDPMQGFTDMFNEIF